MGFLNDIRQGFKMGSVAISENGFSIIYTNDSREYILEPFETFMENKDLLIKCIMASDYVSVLMAKNEFIKITFHKQGFSGNVIYPPVEKKLTLDELVASLVEEHPPDDGNFPLFFDMFDGVDLEDDSEVLETLSEFLEATEVENHRVYDISGAHNFLELKKLANKLGFPCTIERNEDGGWIEYSLYQYSFSLTEEQSEVFIKMIDTAASVEIGFVVSDPQLVINFYSK